MIDDNDDIQEDPALIDSLNSLLSQVSVAPGPPVPPPSQGFAPQQGVIEEPVAIPEATLENFVCLRDCRHYFERKTFLAAGNSLDSLGGKMPVLVNRQCLKGNIDLTDETIFTCSHWDPLSPQELHQIKVKQSDWTRQHPEVTPVEV